MILLYSILWLLYFIISFPKTEAKNELSTKSQSKPMNSISAEDVLMVATLDGKIHGIDKSNGRLMWSFKEPFGPMLRSIGPWSGKKPNDDIEDISMSDPILSSKDKSDIYVVEPQEAGIFVIRGDRNIQRLPIDLKQLVQVSPFKSSDGRIFIGNKKSKILSVDIFTGKILFSYDSNNLNEQKFISSDDIVHLGRTEYSIQMYQDTFMNTKPIWNISYVEYSSVDSLRYPRTSSKRFAFGVDGFLFGTDDKTKDTWAIKFNAPAVKIFSVGLDRNDGSDMASKLILSPEETIKNPEDTPRSGLSYHINFINKHDLYALEYSKYVGSSESFGGNQPLTIEYDNCAIDESQKTNYDDNYCSSSCIPGDFRYPECIIGNYKVENVPQQEKGLINFPEKIFKEVPENPYSKLTLITLTTFAVGVVSFLLIFSRSFSVPGQFVKLNFTTDSLEPIVSPLKDEVKDSGASEKVGELEVSDQIIGLGSHGTVVYKGTFHGREIAIKRLLLDFYDVAHHEVDLLLKADQHRNVIRYYCKEISGKFMYLGLELCEASLHDIYEVPEKASLKSKIKLNSIFSDTARGLEHLHNINIVHRDLKPANILINIQGIAMISDFGLCKKLLDDQSSFGLTAAQSAGTIGWRAPESIQSSGMKFSSANPAHFIPLSQYPSSTRLTKAVDIFSLGLIFAYAFLDGNHPFGDRLVREKAILAENPSINLIENSDYELFDLVTKMLKKDPAERLSIEEVLRHPYFWSTGTKLQFLLDLSDRLDVEDKNFSDIVEEFEGLSWRVFGDQGWQELVDQNLFQNLGKYRKYDNYSFQDLLRAIRNKKNHFLELPDNIQELLSPIPGGFMAYFQQKFPKLLITCFEFALKNPEIRFDPHFHNYF